MGGLKDILREKLCNSKNARIVKVTLDVNGEPATIGVRQASLAVRKRILKIADGKLSDPGNLTATKIQCVIDCAVDPESGEALFNDRDRDLLMEQPSGGWIDRIADEAILLFRGPTADSCPKCKGEPPAGSSFCNSCGAELPSPAEVAEKN